MAKWDHLIESTEPYRAAERAYKSEQSPENALAYVTAMSRYGSLPPKADIRFRRLMAEFKEDPNPKRAEWIIMDLARVTGPSDRSVSETCRLMGKMGRVCNQASQTQITTKYFVILRSYTTPVAYKVIGGKDEPDYRTDTRHSSTTTNHVSKWIDWPAEDVSQREIDELYRNAV